MAEIRQELAAVQRSLSDPELHSASFLADEEAIPSPAPAPQMRERPAITERWPEPRPVRTPRRGGQQQRQCLSASLCWPAAPLQCHPVLTMPSCVVLSGFHLSSVCM